MEHPLATLALTALLAVAAASAHAQAGPRPVEQPRLDSAPRAQTGENAAPFKDCPDCPEMVAMAAGSFDMGNPVPEVGRYDSEGPQHRVSVQPFALGKTEVTVGQFRRFVQATGYRSDAERNVGHVGCFGWKPGSTQAEWHAGWYWDNPGFAQDDRYPAACLSWNDANAYVAWLAKASGKRYRLPSEAEWEYAARAGTRSSRYWGDDPNQACRYANVRDTAKGPNDVYWPSPRHQCSDGYFFAAPAASYAANAFGLHDMIGNVWEWVEDCWHEDFRGAPTDGGAWTATECPAGRVMRGGSWIFEPGDLTATSRDRDAAADRYADLGFRPARSLP